MSKETIVVALGLLVFFSPFLGLPRAHTEWLLMVCGALLMIVGYRLRRLAFLRSLEDGSGRRRADDVFVETPAPSVSLQQKTEGQELHV